MIIKLSKHSFLFYSLLQLDNLLYEFVQLDYYHAWQSVALQLHGIFLIREGLKTLKQSESKHSSAQISLIPDQKDDCIYENRDILGHFPT